MTKQEMQRLLALVGRLTRTQRQQLVAKLTARSNAGGVHRSAGVGRRPEPGVPALQERTTRVQRPVRRTAALGLVCAPSDFLNAATPRYS